MFYFRIFFAVYLISFSSNAFAECRIVEHNDSSEVVCEDNPPPNVPKNIVRDDKPKTPSIENVSDKMKQMAKLTDEYPLFISSSPSKILVAEKLSSAEDLMMYVEHACQNMGNPLLLKRAGLYIEAAKSEQCNEYKYLGAKWLASIIVNTGKYYALLGDKINAKKLFRDVIVRFTGTNYKSQVKEAEFGLEDLK